MHYISHIYRKLFTHTLHSLEKKKKKTLCASSCDLLRCVPLLSWVKIVNMIGRHICYSP